ncbi:SGNH/GDSL hydrolase family protein [Candidatus Saccharibacteria bacterium]|nr:SGNH/GDSL hydrolase family protein [Candidatus Saccharibacteria bacterium]
MKLVIIFLILVFTGVGIAVFTTKKPELVKINPGVPEGNIVYLPLGDSYTIGQGVSESERWPNQLASELEKTGIGLTIGANPSRTGFTSQDLIDNELPFLAQTKPDFVTVQIGVNDWVQGVPAQTFQKNLQNILDQLQAAQAKILIVTIPDFGKTPSGAGFGKPEEITAGLQAFNKIIQGEASKRNIPVADVFASSQQVTNDSALVAPDGLHPSGKQYAQWTEIILPLTIKLLDQ